MAGRNGKRIVVLLLCLGFSFLMAEAIRNSAGGAIKAIDLAEVYYGAQCAIDLKDPYDPATVLRQFEVDGGKILKTNAKEERDDRTVISVAVYPPTTLFVAVPFAMLPWPVARGLWLGLTTGLMVLAALSVWDLGGEAPAISGGLACFILANSYVLLVGGNPAGIVIPLGVIAAWCFLRERYAVAGVLMLALSLVIKPHDVGFVWLYFLLAGGTGRKRALQTLAIAAVVGICAAVWIAPRSPHWVSELHQNLELVSRPGNTSDPGPTGRSYRSFFQAVDLQVAASAISGDPHVYNPVSYAIGGALILLWGIAVLRKRFTDGSSLLALAAISILTLLPVYHRPYDAKLLLLAVPGCAMLWAGKGARRWVALGLTSAAIFFTSDIPLTLWASVTAKMPVTSSSIGGKLTLLMLQPAPLVLLAAGCFYLWVYTRNEWPADRPARLGGGAIHKEAAM